MSERFDVAVVGAGPAGSTLAWRLADAGHRVVMLDRQTFPRDKPCGGGVTARGIHLIPVDITPVVERTVRRVDLGMGYASGDLLAIESDAVMVHMTQRRRLDAHLAQAAAGHGVDFRDGVRVRDVVHTADGADVVTDAGRIRARAVVGADGANGAVRGALGVPAPAYAVALEGNLPRGAGGLDDSVYQDAALLEFDTVPGGYAWIFPKGDHLNLGVGGYLEEGPRMRAHLDAMCAAHGVDPDALEAVRGHRLPIRRSGTPVAVGRCLLVGDAAGLVDPFSGDGMYEAFMSSSLASGAIDDLLTGRAADLSAYPRELGAALGAHRAGAWLGKLTTQVSPRLTTMILSSDRVRAGIASRMCRGTTPPSPGVSAVAVAVGRLARRALGEQAA